MEQQVLSHERHSEIGLQSQHMHFQAWEEFAKTSAFGCK